MTTLPAWTEAEWANGVAEPFRSDRAFWSGLAASADALVTLVAAIAVAIVLALSGERAWSFLPFAVPAVPTVRAALISRASSRRSREVFENRQAWRNAEREAVASAFFRVLGRRRGTAF